jgi:LmbE family N-acetylglucosaminyl deacetylase
VRAAGALAVAGVALVTAGAAISVVTLLMPALGEIPPAAAASSADCAGGAMQIVAHQDDDLFFLSPDVLHDIEAGRCVRTVYVTAGDAGHKEDYWGGREAGARAAYAAMAGVEDAWTASDAGVPGRSILKETLTAAPNISLVFLRLPDGRRTGAGNAVHDYESLMRLWQGDIPEMTAVDSSETYTAADLHLTLSDLLIGFGPTTVRTQDWTIPFRHGDNADHTATALFAQEADQDYTAGHRLLAYGGYPQWTRPANVSGADLQAKARVLLTYAGHDRQMCVKPWCTGALVSSLRVGRQYIVATESRTDTAQGDGVLVTASSESTTTGQGAAKAVDGIPSGSPSSRTTEWRTEGGGVGSWLQLDFPSPVALGGVVLNDRPNLQDNITSGTLVFSDGSTVAVGPLPDNGSALTVAFAQRTVTSVRLRIDGVSATTHDVGLSEIETYAALPMPAANAGSSSATPVAGSAHDVADTSLGSRRAS